MGIWEKQQATIADLEAKVGEHDAAIRDLRDENLELRRENTSLTEAFGRLEGGSPAIIVTDSPESVEPLSLVRITFFLLDSEGRVVEHANDPFGVGLVEGQGSVTPVGEGMTRGGVGAFDYLAPKAGNTATILIQVGSQPELRELAQIVTIAP